MAAAESESFLPSLVMVVVQVGFAGLNVVSKLAMDSGMSPYVMVTYRQVVATLFLAPIAYFTERKSRMDITRAVLFQIFLCSIFGATVNQFLYFLGLKYSTPTIASALSNTLPAITFVMAALFRMESVEIKSLAGQAKVAGTAVCVGGSMLMTFYKGSLIKMGSSGIHWKYAEALTTKNSSGAAGEENMALGAALVVASCVAWAIWFIIQARMSAAFSSPYTSTSIMSFMASVECLAVAATLERSLSSWALGWDIRLIASLYTGVVVSGLSFSLMSWCIQRRGPLYVSMFSPLVLIIVAVVSWAVMDDKIYVGSAAGSVLIVVGLYFVLWGKGEEELKQTGRSTGIKLIDEEEHRSEAKEQHD